MEFRFDLQLINFISGVLIEIRENYLETHISQSCDEIFGVFAALVFRKTTWCLHYLYFFNLYLSNLEW